MNRTIICAGCGEVKIVHAKNLCKSCYSIEFRKTHPNYDNAWHHRTGRHQSMSENKSCASYLGCHVAEQVLSETFEDVQVMPFGNHGFDFICSNGFKIDVKSGCIIKNGYAPMSWKFHIERNEIADYFLCLAFDNRESLNPLHIWLFPGHMINDKTQLYISESLLTKWSKYELDIDKVIRCCDVMKDGN